MLTLRDEMATMLDRTTLADRLNPEPAFINSEDETPLED